MQIPREPWRQKAPRRRKPKPPKLQPVYTIRGCAGCVQGCPDGKTCRPDKGQVHGRCLHAYLQGSADLVGGVVYGPVPGAKCLQCGGDLA